MTQDEKMLIVALCGMLEWAKGNRGRRNGNPYCVPEVMHALSTLKIVTGYPGDWLDVDTEAPTYFGNREVMKG